MISLNKKYIGVGTLLIVLIGISFLTGAFAHRSCAFPFCRGYYVSLKDNIKSTFGAGSSQAERIGADTLQSNLYHITSKEFTLEVGKSVIEPGVPSYRDGGLDNAGDSLIIASNQGDIYYVDKKFEFYKMSPSIPFSRDEFDEYIESGSFERGENQPSVTKGWFAVKDIHIIDKSDDEYILLASYNNWNSEDECHNLRVSEITITQNKDGFSAQGSEWSQIYETTPCLELKDDGHPFSGHQSGGRIASLSNDEVLVSVGDFEFDGLAGRNLPQDSGNDYGKIIHIDRETGESRIFAQGFRNPQGLYIDQQGRIWATDHGPKGGDELNKIEEGNNYGWPQVTYGTCYGHEVLYTEKCDNSGPLATNAGTHDKYVRPIISWVPSIATSEIISIEQDLFDRWNGDLLISSLSGNKLYRTRIREGRVVLSEPIQIGDRIRDLVEREDGSVVLKTDRGKLIVLRPVTEETA